MKQLSGKTALITGALGTIGTALVERFAAEGAVVIAADRPGTDAPQIGSIHRIGFDLNDLAGTEATALELSDRFGGIDILINNAATVVNKSYEAFSIAEYEEEIRVNSSAAFVLSRALSRRMIGKGGGKIVCMTSLTMTGEWEGFVPYVASKGAMFGLVKSLAREFGRHNINVNGISPGAVVSDAEWRHFGDRRERYHNWILERQSLKKRIEPADIANLALFLSSSQADLITGQDIRCDGGW